ASYGGNCASLPRRNRCGIRGDESGGAGRSRQAASVIRNRPSPFAKTSRPVGRSTGTPSITAPRSTTPSRGLTSKRAPAAVCGKMDGPPWPLWESSGPMPKEEIRGVEMVELAVHVVDPDQGRKPIAKKVLLNPRLFERPCRRGFDAAHA